MKFIVAIILMLTATVSRAETAALKPQKFIDVVYKIKSAKDKSLISFRRTPTIYEVGAGDQKETPELLKKLEGSQKNKKPIEVIVDPLSRKILEVKDL